MKSTFLVLVPLFAALVTTAPAQKPGAHGVNVTVKGTPPPQVRENPGAASPTHLYVFGGASGNAGSSRTNGLYAFDAKNATWTTLTANGATGSPPARDQAGVCWDATRKKLIVFGGHAGSGTLLNDTWEFDVATAKWKDITPATTSPSKRRFHSIAHDPVTGSIILFGGLAGTTHLNDTWMFSGGAVWTKLTTKGLPATRRQHHLESRYDFKDILLCGGQDVSLPKPGRFRTDVWRFVGLDWVKLSIKGTPAAVVANESAYDPIRKRLVLMCGNGITAGSPTGIVSEFDCVSNTWVQRFGVSAPDPVVSRISRYFAAFVASTGAIYKISGQSPALANGWRNTVMYQSEKVATATTGSAGCAGSAGVPTLTAPGLMWQGRNLVLEVDKTPTGSNVIMGLGFTKINVPLSLLGLGPASCVLTVNPLLVFPAARSSKGVPTLSLPVPNSPVVLTMPPLMAQGLVVTGSTAVISNRLDLKGGAL